MTILFQRFLKPVDEVIPVIQILEIKVSDEEVRILSEISISKVIYDELKAIVKQGYYVSPETEEMRILLNDNAVKSTKKLIEINSDFEKVSGNSKESQILYSERKSLLEVGSCDKYDLPPYQVYIESKGKNIGQLRDMAIENLLLNSRVEGVKRVDTRGRNRVAIKFLNLKAANKFLASDFLEKNKYDGFIPNHLVSCKCVIRNIDTNIYEEFLQENLKAESNRSVIAVKRIRRKVQMFDQKANMVNTASVIVTFRGKSLPKFATIIVR
ncbi:hypothetical protein QE152_g38654 [Popillia japonica]|uniref:Uncharacterized protein n=1 Tax=Popillia japonica TaxID=7064 RepID=A0AAW1HW28_POPJA